MSRWNTEKQFASWLGLWTDNRISGKVPKSGARQDVNRAAKVCGLPHGASSEAKALLGANFRRLRSKLGAPKAITAMAHKLARLKQKTAKLEVAGLRHGYDVRSRTSSG